MPTRSRLVHKGIHVPLSCILCGSDVEHSWHLFLDCHYAKNCWDLADVVIDIVSTENFHKWLFKVFDTAHKELGEKNAMILWMIWNQRNKKFWDDSCIFPSQAVIYSLNY